MAKKQTSFGLGKYAVIVLASLVIGFGIAYLTSYIEVSSTDESGPACLECIQLPVIQNNYGLPLQYKTITKYVPIDYRVNKESTNYGYYLVDGMFWSVLVFGVIFTLLKLLDNRRK